VSERGHFGIVVCVKPVPDPKSVGSGGPAVDRASGRVNREGVPLVANRNDRVALEAALRFASGVREEGARVTALLMGPPAAEAVARQCLALGADEAWLLCDRALAGSDALATAKALAAGARRLGRGKPPDLVVTGVESSDGGTGQVGPTLAALLGLHYVVEVAALRPVRGRAPEPASSREDATGTMKTPTLTVEADVATEDDREPLVVEAELPLLVTVSRTTLEPPVPTMMGIVKARSRPFEVLTLHDVGLDPSEVGERGSPTKVSRLLPYSGGKTARMLTGSLEEQAQALALWLRENGFLESAASHGSGAPGGGAGRG